MHTKQKLMKEWLLDLCENDLDCDKNFRKLLVENKNLTRRIKEAFDANDLYQIQKLIDDFISEKNILFLQCKECKKFHLIYDDNYKSERCVQCQQLVIYTYPEKYQEYTSKKKEKEFYDYRQCDSSEVRITDPYTAERNSRIKSPEYIRHMEKMEQEQRAMVEQFGSGELPLTCGTCNQTHCICG